MDKKIPPLAKALILAALAGLPAVAAAADLDGMARQLADGARAAGLRSVAVARLEPPRGRDDGRSDALTEDLTLALVRSGRVQTVERSQIGKLAEELKLDRTGAVAGAANREARLASIDALVVGRWEQDGARVRVFARVVDAQTGVIVAAAGVEIASEPASEDGPERDAVVDLPAPRAAAARSECADASRSVADLQEDLLELKARYWAFRLRLGADGVAASADARATFPDAGQRQRYMDALATWSAADVIPPLRAAEIARLGAAETRVKDLVRGCRL